MRIPFKLIARRSVLLAVWLVPGHPLHADPGDALDTGGGGIARRYVVHAADAMEHGRLTEAMEYCNRALSEYPNDMAGRFYRGRAEMAGGQYDAAISDFDAVLAAHPEYPTVYIYRGITLLRQHKPEQAIAELNKAMKAQTGIASLTAANVYIYRSLAFEQMGHGDQALADFTDALKTVNGDQRDWTVLGFGCYNAAAMGLLDTAIMDCDESISRHSRNALAYQARAYANLRSKLFDKAASDFSQALYYQDDNAFDLFGRGAAKHALGDRTGGDADIAAATSHEPHIAEIMARLDISPYPAAKPAK